jgi:hypothetical protein
MKAFHNFFQEMSVDKQFFLAFVPCKAFLPLSNANIPYFSFRTKKSSFASYVSCVSFVSTVSFATV